MDPTDFSAVGDFYYQASNGSVALPVAGYNYNSDWTPLLVGLAPTGMAASLAAQLVEDGKLRHLFEASFNSRGSFRQRRLVQATSARAGTTVLEQGGAMTRRQILEDHIASPVSILERLMLQDAGERQAQCAASFDERLEDRVGVYFVGVYDRRD